ncbi:MAG: DNA polymerase III subunit delta [Planctomycetota bacterium]|nr:DNA polymerase III subunit delta [Planctomycetota bacterium]
MAAKTASEKTASKPTAIHAFDFVASNPASAMPPIIACFGSDDFLRRMAIHHWIVSSKLDSETIRSYDGDEDSWRDVHDELATRSLFDAGGGRLAIVRGADKFVTKNREALERWAENFAPDSSLVLELQTLAANTKLYKLIAKNGVLVNCTPPQKASWGNPPDEKAMQKWIIGWSKSKHGLQLSPKQSLLVIERIGAVCGLIDCELAKLALFANSSGDVPDERVSELVGGWRTQTAWELADAIADGQVAVAIEQLDKLLTAGQNAVGLMAQLSWSLRRFGLAAQLVEQSERVDSRIPLSAALERSGFNRFDVAKAESRLKRIGRPRAKQMLVWLVELELKLKGSHSNDHRARLALESLIMKLG